MTRRHEEIIHEIGEGWAVAWDATQVSPQVQEAFERAAREQREENAEVRDRLSREDQAPVAPAANQ